jgi:copper chaperone CopZ
MTQPTMTRVARFPLSGMTCQACARSASGLLLGVPGVRAARVEFGSRSAEVTLEEGVGEAALRKALTTCPPGALGARAVRDDVAYHEAAELRARRAELRALVPLSEVRESSLALRRARL